MGSLFAGIGGFDLGFERAGFRPLWRCEIEPFCQKVLINKLPAAEIYADVRGIGKTHARVDVLVGGFPCQDLSVAGKRGGLQGERSGLFFEFVRIIRALQPRWWVIENVPGFLSSAGGRDFGLALRTLDECGYVGGWRVLDSQYFNLAQRRERVFLVGHLGGFDHGTEAVLFESASGVGDSAASIEAGADITGQVAGGAYGSGRRSEDDPNLVAYTLRDNQRNTSQGPANYIAATLNSGGNNGGFRTEPGEHLVLSRNGGDVQGGYRSMVGTIDTRDTLRTDPGGIGQAHNTTFPNGVRRLTPLECERLQGFPDGWTCLCGNGHRGSQFCKCSDSPRYKALGNAVSVPVAQWIAERIKAVEMGA